MHPRITAAIAIVGVFIANGAHAASVVTLSPTAAHPSQAIALSGTGFGASEPVDVYVDTTDTLLLVTSASGTLSAAVTVPTAAQPGSHYITAIGRKSGDAAQASITVTTPWVEFGYGQTRLGLNPYENTLTTSNVSSLGLSWSVAGPGGGGGGGTPAVSAGLVIAGGQKGIQSRQASTGAVVWTALANDAFYDSPAVSGQNVYIGNSGGYLCDLNLATGATIWSKHLDSTGVWFSSPVVVGNVVYVGTYGGRVYAVNASTGATIWSTTTTGVIDSSPAVANGLLYIGSGDLIYALNATTGALVWSYTTGGSVESSPAVANGTVYVGSDDDYVYALQAATGVLVWKYATGGPVYASPALAYGSVFIGSADDHVYSLNSFTGAAQWSVQTNSVAESPSVANGVVYGTSRSGVIYALAASNGAMLAAGTLGFGFFGSPAVSDGVVYLDTYAGNISAIALLGGTAAARPVAPRVTALRPDYRLTLAQ